MPNCEKCLNIRNEIESRGLKQKWVADKSNIDYQRFRRLMTGHAILHADEADRINASLGTNF